MGAIQRLTLYKDAETALMNLMALAENHAIRLAGETQSDHGCRPNIGVSQRIRDIIGKRLYENGNALTRRHGYSMDLGWAPKNSDDDEVVYAPYFVFKRHQLHVVA